MLNTYANLKINACSGGIYKTYKESWFVKFHLDSTLAGKLFRKSEAYINREEVVILQMVICGNSEVIAEVICKNDLDKCLEADLLEKV